MFVHVIVISGFSRIVIMHLCHVTSRVLLLLHAHFITEIRYLFRIGTIIFACEQKTI